MSTAKKQLGRTGGSDVTFVPLVNTLATFSFPIKRASMSTEEKMFN